MYTLLIDRVNKVNRKNTSRYHDSWTRI